MSPFFTSPYRVRLTPKLVEDIEWLVKEDNGERYDSISHFIRCAIIEKIRNEK